MKQLLAIAAIAASFSVGAATPKLPIRSGTYTFQHRFAEQPNLHNRPLTAEIRGRHIAIVSDAPGIFPKGVVEDGTLMWHAKSKQWIIGESESDRYAKDVGGCSAGPTVVDLKNKVFWSC